MTSTWLAGVDGCKGGWIVASTELETGSRFCRRIDALEELFTASPPSVVAIDVPIGLMESGARRCDVEARRMLGKKRSSVFTAPIRPALAATSHATASAMRRSVEGKGMSIQSWCIVPKIREVDDFLARRSELREIVREVHPEVCFTLLNGNEPILSKKKRRVGREARVAKLRVWCGAAIDDALFMKRSLACEPDDIVDAFASLWTAERIHAGTAMSLSRERQRDLRGLMMEILA